MTASLLIAGAVVIFAWSMCWGINGSSNDHYREGFLIFLLFLVVAAVAVVVFLFTIPNRNLPNAVSKTGLHGWYAAQRGMDLAEVVNQTVAYASLNSKYPTTQIA